MKILLDQKSVHVALRQRSRSPVFAFQDFPLCVCGACTFEGESVAQFAGYVVDERRHGDWWWAGGHGEG